MNVQTGDALLTSIEYTDDVKADGTVYGKNLNMGAADRFLEGRMKVRFHVNTTFAGSGDIELALFSGAATDPTTKVKSVFTGLKTDLTAGTIKELVLETHQLDKYVRLGVVNSGAASAGALRADLVPIA